MTTTELKPNRAHEPIIRQALARQPRQPRTMNGHTYGKYYNPTLIRRRERLVEVVNDVAFFECYSMRREGREVKHHQQIALSGARECRCDCEHFQYKLAKGGPTMFSKPWALCKHLHKALGILERRGELPQQNGQFSPPCCKCGQIDADDYYPAVDERGFDLPGAFLCCDCAAGELPVDAPEPATCPCGRMAETDCAGECAYHQHSVTEPARAFVTNYEDSLGIIDE